MGSSLSYGSEGAHRKLRILSVEDDILVAMGTTGMLEDLGHSVVEASSGEQALALLERGLEVDMLITDQGMQGISGVQLVEAVREMTGGMPALLVTGYLRIPIPDGPKAVVLRKPFRASELEAAIRQAMPDGTMSEESMPDTSGKNSRRPDAEA
jgi:CheY-like chemotaxis protein